MAPPVKNWKILLEQSFTATTTSDYEEDARVLLNSVIYTISIPSTAVTILK